VKLRTVCAAALAAGLGAALVTQSGGARPRERDLGPTAPATQISFVVALRANERRLARDARAGTSNLSAAELGRRYGPPLAAEHRIERELEAHGISVTATYPQRTEIDARASVRALGRYLHLRYRDRLDPTGVRYHAPVNRPRLPKPLGRWVAAVVGLSTRPVLRPADVRQGALVPRDARLAYDVTALHKRGIDGRGMTIAALSYAPFGDADVAYYRRFFGITGPSPSHVRVGPGSDPKADPVEADLDVQVASAIAPRAQIVEYEAPNSASGELAMFNQALAGKSRIVSYSWGLCDEDINSAFRQAIEQPLREASRRGITIFVASGDSGAYDCQRSDFADHRLTVDFPADSPSVVAVGGTVLSVRSDGTYLGESGWEDSFTNGGGGGGLNRAALAPSWQRAHGIGGGKYRAVPDVSATASPASGWFIRDDGWQAVGGTSAAAPFWAGSMLLAEELAARSGVKQTCFLAPLLYRLAYTSQRYRPFHDVTSGGNRHFDARPGWDFATGLGSPDVWNLARDLVADEQAHGCA